MPIIYKFLARESTLTFSGGVYQIFAYPSPQPHLGQMRWRRQKREGGENQKFGEILRRNAAKSPRFPLLPHPFEGRGRGWGEIPRKIDTHPFLGGETGVLKVFCS